MTGPSCRSSISADLAAREPPGGERGGEERRILVRPAAHVRERQARRRPRASRRRRPRSRRAPTGARARPATRPSPRRRELEHGSRVMGHAAMALALVALRDTRRRATGSAAERRAAFAASAAASPPWPSASPCRRCPGRSRRRRRRSPAPSPRRAPRRRGDALRRRRRRTAPTATADLEQPALPSARARASESETGSAPPGELEVRDPDALADPGADRRELAVERAADDRHPVERLRELRRPPRRDAPRLQRRVRELHHVRARLGRRGRGRA